MSKQERVIHSEILERIESENPWDSGNKMLEVTIDYVREARTNRPRGYYLTLVTNLHTDRGGIQSCLSFGDEGDQFRRILIEEAKAFSQKKLDAITVTPETLTPYINEAKAEYVRRRDIAKAKQAAYATV